MGRTRQRSKTSPKTGRKNFIILSSIPIIIAACISIPVIVLRTNLIYDSLHQIQGETISAKSEDIELYYDDIDTAIKPFQREKFNLANLFDEGPRWGSLNSGHYFSLKLSVPDSIETSLAWYKNQLNHQGLLNIRHLCDQNDGLDFYSWMRHDFHTFGQQMIIDGDYKLLTSFIKDPDEDHSWRALIRVAATKEGSKLKPFSVIKYLTVNNPKDKIKLDYASITAPNEGLLFAITGESQDIGSFKMTIGLKSKQESFIRGSKHIGYVDKNRSPISSYLHNHMRSILLNGSRIYEFANDLGVTEQPNIIAYQLTVDVPAAIMISFGRPTENDSGELTDYELNLNEKIKAFDKKFERKFPLPQENSSISSSREEFAKIALSNMLGSIGYFNGYSIIGSSLQDHKTAAYGPIQLLTGVPSRSFFPRGFLWDEGFHNLLISRWDSDLSIRIIRSWFDIMNHNGWIPREVILGVESLRRVPNEFIVQRIANANPPAMFIVIENLLDEDKLSSEVIGYLYPRLKRWFNWFNTTQVGPRRGTYRWRGRDQMADDMLNPKTLTSGLDDYPRASHPSSDEYHLDLRCWMALVTRTLKKMAVYKNDEPFRSELSKTSLLLMDESLLNMLHWSEREQMYCDFGYSVESAKLVQVMKQRPSERGGPPELVRVMERQTIGQPKFGCVPEFGYVSLFPMMLKLLDASSHKLGILLDKMRNEHELWSKYGIRSLSKRSKHYNKYNTEHDKPYWRGAIWLNMNYLILTSLEYYSKLDGPHREKCSTMLFELRQNLVDNTLREFIRTNFIWENYDDSTGHGQGSHPFTGWSSLILPIMSGYS